MDIVLTTASDTLQLTPGPSGIHPDVQAEVARQTLNHTHPDFLEECRAVQRLARILFGTTSDATGVLTASGTGGNEAGVMNFVHPGDKAVYINAGFFSGRMGDMIRRRCPGEAIELPVAFGDTIDPDAFEATLARYGKGEVSAAFVAQIETSAGTQVPDEDLEALGAIARKYGTMLCVDAVCALGCVPVHADRWQAAYVSACSQKGVNAPPGTAPFTVAPFAMERIKERRKQGLSPGSLYFDLEANMRYWTNGTYHATPAIQGIYALRKAMEMTIERAGGDLPRMFAQHVINQRALEAGLENIGFVNPVQLEKRAGVVSVLITPDGVNARELRRKLLGVKEVRGRRIAGVECAAGKRDPETEIRVALLGLWSSKETVLQACDAVEQVTGNRGRAVAAAEKYFAEKAQPSAVPVLA
ncbi:MAG: aminotransferase class V-fold PLP-dependent enzyme [Candidatus Peribacteraceae bacterium]|nr:aminotransferase class V-fold PLP-dependent enzyme [Candidatus Peribacteraceae bacterium]